MARQDIPDNKANPDSEKTGVYIAKVVTDKGLKEVHRSRRLARKQGNNATPSIGSLNEANRLFKSEEQSASLPPSEAGASHSHPISGDVIVESYANLPTTPPPLLSPDESLPSTESIDLSPELVDVHRVEGSKPSDEINDVNTIPSNSTSESQRLPGPPTLLQNAIGFLTRPSLTFGLTLGTGLFLTGFGLPVAAFAFAGSFGSIEFFRKISQSHTKPPTNKAENPTPSVSSNDEKQDKDLLSEYGLDLGSSSLLFNGSSDPTVSSSPSRLTQNQPENVDVLRPKRT